MEHQVTPQLSELASDYFKSRGYVVSVPGSGAPTSANGAVFYVRRRDYRYAMQMRVWNRYTLRCQTIFGNCALEVDLRDPKSFEKIEAHLESYWATKSRSGRSELLEDRIETAVDIIASLKSEKFNGLH